MATTIRPSITASSDKVGSTTRYSLHAIKGSWVVENCYRHKDHHRQTGEQGRLTRYRGEQRQTKHSTTAAVNSPIQEEGKCKTERHMVNTEGNGISLTHWMLWNDKSCCYQENLLPPLLRATPTFKYSLYAFATEHIDRFTIHLLLWLLLQSQSHQDACSNEEQTNRDHA